MEEKNKNKDSTAMTTTKPPLIFSESQQNPDSENDCFQQSLKELKDLRPQLYHAAGYYENAFLKSTAKQKKILLASTKEYVRKVVVTVVDHLGTVSSNHHKLVVYGDTKISDIQKRMDCLKQRLLTCQQYALRLDLTFLQWSTRFPRHHRHYVSPLSQNLVMFNSDSRDVNRNSIKENKFETAGSRPSFDSNMIVNSPVTYLTPGTELADVVPVIDEAPSTPSTPHTPCTPMFGSPAEETFKLKSNDMKKKTSQGSNFLSFLKKSKRRI